MSEKSPQQAPNELIQWLKMLSLPTWAKIGLAIVMILAIAAAIGLVVLGVIQSDSDTISSGVTALTIAMPVSLIVTAMVFDQGGTQKLKKLTFKVLDKDIPEAVLSSVSGGQFDDTKQLAELKRTFHNCICEYVLTARHENCPMQVLHFKVELNVRKVNVVIWLPDEVTKTPEWRESWAQPYMSSIKGAEKEGYVRNEHPAEQMIDGKMRYGIVFIKPLDVDFLLKPAERLYFAQDFAFFIRSLLDVSTQNV